MTIKVLQLHGWMSPDKRGFNDTISLSGERYKSVSVKFKRDGIYFNSHTKDCWFETKGVAYSYPVEDFKYNLKLVEATEIDSLQISALKEIIKQGLATLEQRKLLGYINNIKALKRQHYMFNRRHK